VVSSEHANEHITVFDDAFHNEEARVQIPSVHNFAH